MQKQLIFPLDYNIRFEIQLQRAFLRIIIYKNFKALVTSIYTSFVAASSYQSINLKGK